MVAQRRLRAAQTPRYSCKNAPGNDSSASEAEQANKMCVKRKRKQNEITAPVPVLSGGGEEGGVRPPAVSHHSEPQRSIFLHERVRTRGAATAHAHDAKRLHKALTRLTSFITPACSLRLNTLSSSDEACTITKGGGDIMFK